ncbi:hypothetical protein PGT21_022439 [Puccinia graminis f. sp. tritici]|uniref:Uncharacterized protein n=1 Tax=Puccinia graminis f. sp. tritici TaxID=56615 RepID=A0A5B0NUP8_PUCGR|nr:hypothetical protein PGT21_022439 [Puccinia graminis f. sp. tritici]KAA1092366.1 hypothetical protein PGTUg99_023408 [Puccinia graminis f. sp. tritici]
MNGMETVDCNTAWDRQLLNLMPPSTDDYIHRKRVNPVIAQSSALGTPSSFSQKPRTNLKKAHLRKVFYQSHSKFRKAPCYVSCHLINPHTKLKRIKSEADH